MKKIITLSLAVLMSLSLLTACGGGAAEEPAVEKTPEELTELFVTAITDAREADFNDAFPIVTADAEDAQYLFPALGFEPADTTSAATSISMMMVHAYGIAAIRPAEGKEETVLAGLQGFIDLQKMNFEMYLPDQYDIACNAKLETLEDGTVLMVMCEGQDEIFEAIKSAILA